jgi:hypothetical protein
MARILLFILVKYLALYLFIMFQTQNFTLLIPRIRNGQDLFYYLWVFLSIPVAVMLIFSIPLLYALSSINKILTFSLLTFFIIGEFFLYSYLSSAPLMTAFVNSLFSILFLFLFFAKSFRVNNK